MARIPENPISVVRRNADSLVEQMNNSPETVVGLPYYQLLSIGEPLLPTEPKEELQAPKTYPEIKLKAGQVLDIVDISRSGFNDLNNIFEVSFQQEIAAVQPPPHVAQNPKWLKEWTERGNQIIEASMTRITGVKATHE